jgi:DNA polymerase (family 10)
MATNHSLVALFREMAQLAALDEGSSNAFRARAYENAVDAIASYPGDLKALSERELTAIGGIGASTAKKIREFFQKGTIAKLEELRRKYPPEFVALGRIPGLGPKTLLRLRNELGVIDVETLAAALAGQQIRKLPGLGVKTEQKILESIGRLGRAELGAAGEKRVPVARAMPIARELAAALEGLDAVERVQYCGGLRRLEETVAGIELVVASHDARTVRDAFVTLPAVLEVVESGDDRTSVLTSTGLRTHLRVVAPDRFGAACLDATGSPAHVEGLRARARDRGWTLDADGLHDADGQTIASDTEEAIYAALDLPAIAPPVREDQGEIAQAEARGLPAPIRLGDVKGDLHVHTTLSGDGRSTLEEILAAAADRGYEYLALTDHAEDLAINGATRQQLAAQRGQIDALRGRFPAMALLHGSELNIDRDGGVDYDAEFRRTLDWCVASVHSHFDLPRAEQTRRILAALDDPTVHAIGHLSGRRIGTRSGIDLDVDAVLEKAAATGTALEINAALARLDASSDVLFRARGMDVTFVISTDTHHVREFARMEWGVLQATRGWVDPARIANLWPRERFLAWLEGRHARAGKHRRGAS